MKPNTKYSIRIRTAGEKDKGEWSEKIEVTTLKKVKTPQIPRNLSAEAADSDINLSWDAAKDADSYDVEVNSSVVDNVTVTEYVYGDIEPETEYVFRVRAVNSGAKSGWSDELKVWVPKVYPAGTGNGLLGEYYDDINFRKLVFARVDPGIDFDWGFKAPGPGMDENSFSVRWTGQVQPRYSGKYTFYTYAGNGVRLWVDGKQIIDEWRLLFPRESKGTIELTAGEKYDIRLEYQDGLGEAGVVLSWSSGDQKKQVIPQEQLYCAPKAPGDISAVPHTTSVALNWNEAAGAESYDIDINGELISGVNGSEYLFENLTPDTVYTFKIRSVSSYGTSEWSKEVTVSTLEEQDSHAGNGNGLMGKYYDNIIFKKLIFERVDPTVDFDWGRGTPDPKIKGNTFSVRWEGILLPEYTAKHTLYLYSDDGARLWINGKELIDFWNPHSSKEGSAAIDLVAGEKYDIRIEYFNINKEAKVALYWSNVYEDKQIIPMEQLYTMPGVTSGPEIAPDVYEMTVTWSNTPGAEGYELEVDGAIVNVGLEAAYVHKGLEPNSQHTYRVRAVNELGKGGWSRTVTGLTLPDTPKNLASSSTSYAVALSWEAVPGVISYDIEADGNIIGSTPDTDYVHEGLQPVTEYTYRVRAVNASGAGYWSGPISELTKVGVPANINTVSASTAITFTWDADNEADSYEIELGGAMLDNGNNTAYEYTGLMPNSAHVYRRRAINELGCGDWSELRTKYTSPDIPRNITAASTGYGITLTWDAVEAAAGYDVEVQGSSVDNGNSTTYTHTDLDSNTQRTYRVRAKNEHGLGDWSGIIAKTTLSGVPVNLKEKWVPGTTDRQLLTLTGINPLGSKYDLSLNTASMKDRNGNGTRYSYDNRGLLTEKKVAETGDTVAYTYDMLGSRETMTDATGTSTYEYNGNNWLLSIEKDGEPQISYDYDEIGNIITITDKQGNTTEYTYDRSSRMETVSFEGRTTTYEYDENGNRESISYDGEVEETYSYDKNNSLLKLAEKLKDSAGKELMQKTTSFRYDSNGNEDRRSVEYITLYSKENPKAYEAAVYGEDSAEPIHAVVERTVSQYDGFNRLVRTAVEYAYGCVLKFRS